MNGFITYAEFAGAVIASFGLAMGLQWLGMSGLFHVMPGRAGRAVSNSAAREADRIETEK